MNAAVAALRARDARALERELDAQPALARKPQLVVSAAGALDVAALKLLVRRGADLNAQWRGYRALHAVIQAEPRASGATRIEDAGASRASKRRTCAARRFEARDAPASESHEQSYMPTKARAACLAWLLEHGADPEQLGAWPPARAVLVAAFTGVPAFVETLVEHGCVVDGFVAAARGDVKLVKKTLASSADVAKSRDRGGLTALQCAAASRLGAEDAKVRKAVLEIATLLLDAGADANALTKSWSEEVDVAYFAASPAKREMFELVLSRGADATRALSSAVWNAPDVLGPIALRHGAQPDRALHGGKPLLNDLIRWGQMKQALWLLEHGASPNVPDERGWTAVHQAASRGNARMLIAVLAAGGDRRARCGIGLRPVDIALLARKKVSIELLAD